MTGHDASADFWPQMTNKDPVSIFFPGDNEKCFAGIQTIHVFVYSELSFGEWSFYTKGTHTALFLQIPQIYQPNESPRKQKM